MTKIRTFKIAGCWLMGFAFSNLSAAVTDISTVPLPTLSLPSSTDVKPNVFFVLDDSGSMDWDYLPDWANDNNPPEYLSKNASFNGVAYNPAVLYLPPKYFTNGGILDTATYPGQIGISTATGRNTGAAANPNWQRVKDDGYGVQSANTSNLERAAYFFSSVAGEYCTSSNLRSCSLVSSPTGSYTIPAPLRWCNSNALSTCQSNWLSGSYVNRRNPTPNTATVTVGTSRALAGITVDGAQVLSVGVSGGSSANNTATLIAASINACTTNKPAGSNCTALGYSASVNNNVVTVTGINGTTSTPSLSPSSGITASAFAKTNIPGTSVLGTGNILRVTIDPSINSYPYPGTNAKHANRSDCAGTTCTYVEEMTNYANWWAYYHTRMQMMKTAASNAFSVIDSATDVSNGVSRFRVGYLSINNNTNRDFLNLGEFKTTQKYNWYNKLFGAQPNQSTPLRETLATAGQLYGGVLNGTTLNGSTVVDPLQYSCQQNYTILSTDGYWNGSTDPTKLNQGTSIGNQDGVMPRPFYDGGGGTWSSRTSNLQQSTRTQSAQKGTLQVQTSTVVATSYTLVGTVSKVLMQCNGTSGACGTPPVSGVPGVGSATGTWSAVTSCANGTNNSSPRCGVVPPPAGTTQNVVNRCNTSATISNSSPYTTSNTDGGYVYSSCSYVQTGTSSGSCTYSARTSTPITNTTRTTATECSYGGWSGWQTATSACTPLTQSSGTTGTYRPTATQCQYSFAATAATGTCTPTYVANNYTNLTVYQGCATTTTVPVNVSSCTASAANSNGIATICNYTTPTAWAPVSSCTYVSQSTGPIYTVAQATECQNNSTGGTSNTLADVAAYYYNTDLRNPNTNLGADTTGTCTGPIIAPATTPNDLCADNVPQNRLDVAPTQHMTTFTLGLGAPGQMVYSSTYWKDTAGDFWDVLKGTTASPASGICAWGSTGQPCNWPTPAANSSANIDDLWHAAINGRGDYFSATDPASLSSSLESALTTISNTPRPGTAAAAASSNPNVSSSDNYVFSSSYKSVDWYGELVRQQIDPTTGLLLGENWSAMTLLDCATTVWAANTGYVAGDVFREGTNCYTVTTGFTSGASVGVTSTGTASPIVIVNTDEAILPPATKIPVIAPTSRTIYTKQQGANARIAFNWASLSASQKAYFTAPAISYVTTPQTSGLSQFCASGPNCLTAAQQSNITIAAGGAAGEALVTFLAGDRTYEGTYFRKRTHVLGDIVSSEARYVGAPLYNYADANYNAFKTYYTTTAPRSGVAYVAANDGMLHAFDLSGKEIWAYIPSIVLPNIYALADMKYSDPNMHQYFVDGSPETGDICPSSPSATCALNQWKTILVGGLNRGGKGYYALDITDPTNPQVLWEFTDTNLGYTYGNPKITKLKDGTWVVLVASGYNNADGVGRLYVLNASTGAIIRTIITGAGSAAAPSGVARISAHALSPTTDNTSIAAYGGDLFGNLWRFDINGDVGAAGYDAQKLIQFVDASGNPQSITAKPLEATINGKPVVYIGTGRYLGITDVVDVSIQSFYAVQDNLGSTTYGNPRVAANGFVQQTLTDGTCPAGAPLTVCIPSQVVRTSSSNTVDWTTQHGWYIDFLTGGERAYTDPVLGLGTLMFTTISPQSSSASACGGSGSATASFAYILNYLTGAAVTGAYNVTGISLGSGLVTRPILVELSNGTIRALIRTSSGTGSGSVKDLGGTLNETPTIAPPSGTGTRRVSWRELTTQ
jgi:type IV pilus assembly protein PilY1